MKGGIMKTKFFALVTVLLITSVAMTAIARVDNTSSSNTQHGIMFLSTFSTTISRPTARLNKSSIEVLKTVC